MKLTQIKEMIPSNIFTLGNWKAHITSITFIIGCWTVTLEDIKLIIKEYENINN